MTILQTLRNPRDVWPGDWNPPHVIAWRLIWWLPLIAAQLLLLAIVLIAFGPKMCRRVWRDLR